MAELDIYPSIEMQSQCPFFSKIPGEIRDRIFDYAITRRHRGNYPYDPAEVWYRPGFRYADRRIDCSLLQTCRRIHQETKHLPGLRREIVRVFYTSPPPLGPYLGKKAGPSPAAIPFTNLRTPVGAQNPLYYLKLRRRMLRGQTSRGDRSQDAREVTRYERFQPEGCTLHIFAQQFWLDQFSSRWSDLACPYANITKVIITMRHTDWWNWDDSGRINLEPAFARYRYPGAPKLTEQAWGSHFPEFPNLKEFELELETREDRRAELDEIVQRAQSWEFPAANGATLLINTARTRKTGWIGRKISQSTSSSPSFSRLQWRL